MNYIEVDRGIFRGPHPVTPADYEALKKLDIRFSLDLETGKKFVGDQSPLLEQIRADFYNIRTYNHPLGVILPPTMEELYAAWQFIVSRRDHGNVLVHCAKGVDRTGMVCAFYRVFSQKWKMEMAIAEMKHFGMHKWYFYWVWALRGGLK